MELLPWVLTNTKGMTLLEVSWPLVMELIGWCKMSYVIASLRCVISHKSTGLT